MLIKPKFYDSFRCLAGDCHDTCCAGWEIDVDEDTAAFYAGLDGADGEFVRSRLYPCGDGWQLCHEGERCRFLREDGLCELILKLGEDALCDICREHPRFYSGSETVTIAGHGLCCEEAARLWLESPVEFVIEDDGVPALPEDAAEAEEMLSVIAHLASGGGTLGQRFSALTADGGTDSYPAMRELYASLEAMDASYPARYSMTAPDVSDPRYPKLAACFVFRYWYELGRELAVKFAAASIVMIAALGGDMAEAAKKFSAEVEYDPDNVEKICDFLETHDIMLG